MMKRQSSWHRREGALQYAASKLMLRGRERVSIFAAALQPDHQLRRAILMCKHSTGEQAATYFCISVDYVMVGSEKAEKHTIWVNHRDNILVVFCRSLVPPRQENKYHPHHPKRLKGWFPRDGEQPQPTFTLLVRWTALPQLDLPSFPWTLPASPRQQQQRSPQQE